MIICTWKIIVEKASNHSFASILSWLILLLNIIIIIINIFNSVNT